MSVYSASKKMRSDDCQTHNGFDVTVLAILTGIRSSRACHGPGKQFSSAMYSADGGLIATASENHTTKFWYSATGESVQTMSGHSDVVCFAPRKEAVVSS